MSRARRAPRAVLDAVPWSLRPGGGVVVVDAWWGMARWNTTSHHGDLDLEEERSPGCACTLEAQKRGRPKRGEIERVGEGAGARERAYGWCSGKAGSVGRVLVQGSSCEQKDL